MSSDDQPSVRHNWIKTSVEHEEKFRMLQNLPPDQIEELHGYFVCIREDFRIGTPGRDGTRVYVGLGRDGKEVAVKAMLRPNCEHLAANESEIFCMLKMVKSPNVVRYLTCVSKQDFTYIVLELCEFSLVEYVNRAKDDTQIQFNPKKIIREILTGLETLHKRGYRDEEMILHRDLKPDNVLVDVQYNIRLADFGVSKKIGEGPTTQHTGGKGDTEWQASESIPVESDDPNVIVIYKRKSDVQVAGMLAFYVLTKGGHPFGSISYERPKNISEGNAVALHELHDPFENDFVSWLLEKNIDNRPFADEALKHPFLLSIKDQFNFLVVVGNEPEVSTDNQSCNVVQELNSHSNDYPNGWMNKIHEEVKQGMSSFRQYDIKITSLLRFLRNVQQHFNDTRIEDRVRQIMVEPAEYFLQGDRFPALPLLVHRILRKQAKTAARSEGNVEVWAERPTLKDFF